MAVPNVTFLASAERLSSPAAAGGTYLEDVPWRFCVHTTEVIPSTVEGARAMARRHKNPPHLWAWPERDWLGQTVPLNRSARALKHPKRTPETNKMRAIQVEVIGFAKDSPSKPDEWWRWIGRRVLRPVVEAGFPINLANVARTTGSDGFGVGGKVRMTRDAWRAFDGVCGHANSPDNEHWDPGNARFDLIVAAAASTTPEEEDDDMAPYKLVVDKDGDTKKAGAGKGRIFMNTPAGIVHVETPTDLKALRKAGIASSDEPAPLTHRQITNWLKTTSRGG